MILSAQAKQCFKALAIYFKQILAILRREEVEQENAGAEAKGEVLVGKKDVPIHSGLDSGIDISVTDIQCTDSQCDVEL